MIAIVGLFEGQKREEEDIASVYEDIILKYTISC
jgi:hypothetical protein